MTVVIYRTALHPVHAVLLAGALPLFVGALLSDWAYWNSHQIQWQNFASWLLAGALLLSALALLCALAGLVRGRRGGATLLYLLLLLVTWVVGFIDALLHARDAWAMMPTALVLSAIVSVLALAATWAGFASTRVRGVE